MEYASVSCSFCEIKDKPEMVSMGKIKGKEEKIGVCMVMECDIPMIAIRLNDENLNIGARYCPWCGRKL